MSVIEISIIQIATTRIKISVINIRLKTAARSIQWEFWITMQKLVWRLGVERGNWHLEGNGGASGTV
jgi:hypothetical protein